MNRLEFIQLLKSAKSESGLTTTSLSYLMKTPWGNVRRIESGKSNSNMKSLLQYIDLLGYHIQLSSDLSPTIYNVQKYDDLLSWMKNFRKENQYTQCSLAEAIGCSNINIAYIETKKCVASVDIFLKWVEVFNNSIKLVKNA